MEMKNVIAETFGAMIKEKDIDKITVKAVIEACHISRQTFYYHFQDIMDLVEWSLSQAMQRMLARSLEAETPEKALCVMISHFLESRELIRRLMSSQKRGQIEKMIVQAARAYLRELLCSKSPGVTLRYGNVEVMLDFWACGVTGVLLQSCGQKDLDVQKLANQLSRLIPAQITENFQA